jgi:hypothetical protein
MFKKVFFYNDAHFFGGKRSKPGIPDREQRMKTYLQSYT